MRIFLSVILHPSLFSPRFSPRDDSSWETDSGAKALLCRFSSNMLVLSIPPSPFQALCECATYF